MTDQATASPATPASTDPTVPLAALNPVLSPTLPLAALSPVLSPTLPLAALNPVLSPTIPLAALDPTVSLAILEPTARLPELEAGDRPSALDPAERARWELAAMAGRMRTLEAQLAEARSETQRLRQECDSLRAGEPHRVRKAFDVLRSRLRGTAVEHVPEEPEAEAAAVLPTRLYVAVGLDAKAVQDFVLTLRQRVLVTPDHRPVVLTDVPEFARLRDQDVLLEYVPDRTTWDRHRPDRSWDDVLAGRLARLGSDHDAVRTVVVNGDQPPTLADLLR